MHLTHGLVKQDGGRGANAGQEAAAGDFAICDERNAGVGQFFAGDDQFGDFLSFGDRRLEVAEGAVERGNARAVTNSSWNLASVAVSITTLDPALKPSEIVTERVDNAGLDTVLSNSFGFESCNIPRKISNMYFFFFCIHCSSILV